MGLRPPGATPHFSRSVTGQDGPDRLEENPDVEPQRPVLDVIEVVPHLLGFLLEVVRIAVADLRPACHAWTHRRSQTVVGDVLHENLLIAGGMRAWPDQVHLAPQHVHQLRHFVEPESPQPLAHARDAALVVLDPFGRRLRLARAHRPEFQQIERRAVAARARLHEEHRTARIDFDGERDSGQKRCEQNETDDRNKSADEARDRLSDTIVAKALSENQRARRHRFDGDLAGELLVKFERVFDDNTADARFEQRLERQPAAAVGQRHDDAERLDALDDFRELLDGAEPWHAIRGVWFFLIDHAGDAPRLVGRIHFVYQLRGHRTVAVPAVVEVFEAV